ncbi:MAG: DUF1016 N-terminal domain-containing protein, partial [Burkholderiales bacterium]
MAQPATLYTRISRILESARTGVARTVNTTQVVANWLIGREIVEEEQKGAKRASYGQALLSDLSLRLRTHFGTGYSVDNLEWFRAFYLQYPDLLALEKSDASRRISKAGRISDTLRRKSDNARLPSTLNVQELILHTPCGKSQTSPVWEPGQLNPNLSWTHYRTLLRMDRPEARAFYEIEAIKSNWSARELERQIASLLFDRLARSKDKAGLLKLARKGQEIATAA